MDHIFTVGEKVIAKIKTDINTGYFLNGPCDEISIEGTIQIIDMRTKLVLIHDKHGNAFTVSISNIEPVDWRRRYL